VKIKTLFHFFTLFYLLFLFPLTLVSAKTSIDGVSVLINNEPILASDINQFRQRLIKDGPVDDFALGTMTLADLKANPENQLKYLIRIKMLESEIKRLKLEVTHDRLESELKELAKKNGLSREQLPQAIEAQGLMFSEFQEYTKKRIEHQIFVEQEISSKIRIADEDLMAAYFTKYKKAPNQGFEVDLAHILFTPNKGGRAAARQRAQTVLALLNKGQSFENLVTQYSEETQISEGGFLGSFKNSDLQPKVVTAINGQKKLGFLNDIFETKAGLHLFKTIKKQDIPDPDFVKKKDELRNELFAKQFKQSLEHWYDLKLKEFSITHVK